MERIPKGIYTPDFRSEAVKLMEAEGLSVGEAAKRLSIPKSSLKSISSAGNSAATRLNRNERSALGLRTRFHEGG